MAKCNMSIRLLMVSILIFLLIENVNAQQKNELTIGDPAPALKFSKWIKGRPIKSMDGDQLYVLEFWATWCGPCKSAMPHLTRLQKEYKGRARFIGVNVWEKVAKDVPYKSVVPAVERFVKGNNENMGYDVVVDNNEQFMGDNWLKAAGENGIPSTFVVKDKKVIWIGHPSLLDSILPKILDGTYDMMASKSNHDKNAKAAREQAAIVTTFFQPIEAAVKAKDYQKAFQLIEKAKVEKPEYRTIMDATKFRILLTEVNQEEAIAYAKEWQKGYKSAPSLILGEIYNKEGFTKSTYLWAAQNYQNSNPEMNVNPMILDALASCYAKGGDYHNAVNWESKAVEVAQKALKEKTMPESVTENTVKLYEEALTRYKKWCNRALDKFCEAVHRTKSITNNLTKTKKACK